MKEETLELTFKGEAARLYKTLRELHKAIGEPVKVKLLVTDLGVTIYGAGLFRAIQEEFDEEETGAHFVFVDLSKRQPREPLIDKPNYMG